MKEVIAFIIDKVCYFANINEKTIIIIAIIILLFLAIAIYSRKTENKHR